MKRKSHLPIFWRRPYMPILQSVRSDQNKPIVSSIAILVQFQEGSFIFFSFIFSKGNFDNYLSVSTSIGSFAENSHSLKQWKIETYQLQLNEILPNYSTIHSTYGNILSHCQADKYLHSRPAEVFLIKSCSLVKSYFSMVVFL